MKNKILLTLLVLALAVGMAAGADLDINSVKVPDSYKIIDDDAFYSATSNLEINIEDFELDDVNEDDDVEDAPFKNSTRFNYTVTAGDENSTMNFTDTLRSMYGCVELVEIGGEKYTITVWGRSEEATANATHCLEKVNQLNGFMPLDTTPYQ